MKIKNVISWLLILIIAIPPIVTSPLAIFGIEPVLSVYKQLGYPDWARIGFGVTQVVAGILLLMPKTFRTGGIILWLFGAVILISKVFHSQLSRGIEEIVLLILLIIVLYLGHPNKLLLDS